jgi:hypothetical protein
MTTLFENLREILHYNRRENPIPFQIYFCNYDTRNKFHRKFSLRLDYDSNFVLATFQSYTDLFPVDRLVYLSRDASVTMSSYDWNKVYIIGSIVDEDGAESFELSSLRRAALDGIKSQSLPIESYYEYIKVIKVNLPLFKYIFKFFFLL